MVNKNYGSNCSELESKIEQWLNWDKNEKTIEEINSLVEKQEWKTLKDRLCNRLTFGTAGLRGRMQAGFNSMNDLVIIQTAQGLCDYVKRIFEKDELNKGIIFGYDGRYNSKRFAELSACIFVNAGIPVYLYSKMVITPFVPFGIINKKCFAGVMVTASHNPKDDNGYKVYWSNGAQIIPPHDKNIQSSILNNLEPFDSSWDLSLLKSSLVKDPYDELCKLYVEKLVSIIPKNYFNLNKNSKMKFIYTAMHGVGYPAIQEAFKHSQLNEPVAVIEQCSPDPEFPTVKFPNPEEGKECLVLSIALAEKEGLRVILANDPDADRLACAEKNTETGEWKIFTGNELGALLGWWALQCYLEENSKDTLKDCYFLASTVSSKILHSMAKVEGFNFIETLTGFKWMGNRSVELMEAKKKVLFAFEEAIGFMFSTNVLDKDGVSAAVLLSTMCCYLNANGNKTLQDQLNEIYKKYGFHYTITSYLFCYDPKTIKSIFERIRNFDNKPDSYPKAIGEYNIKYIRDLTTGIDTAKSNGKAELPSSSSTQMITFTFENGVVLTLRTSGTEPKIKYYAEMCAQPEEDDWNKLKLILADVVEKTVKEMLQPQLNNLIPRSDN
ncbi:glucose 1,6-bisphosphate synthase [Condylostylus longicornis]|uniref:glucose 1,6-bisphosphate synthase n=1 Tax=Condylostylus longicornis TaxID=2530218 RepID=UPI00244E1BCA|nr:glucose 1,6-bisphosphate synthase [Condylostylus longicornis]